VRPGSIRLRLLAAAAVAIGIALIVAEIGLSLLFERHVERALDADLAVHLRQLIAGITLQGGKVTVRQGPGDPRFDEPLSGLYWLIASSDGKLLLASRSLWDGRIALPPENGQPMGPGFTEITGPEGTLLRALVQTVEIAVPEEPRGVMGATGAKQEPGSAAGATESNSRGSVEPNPGAAPGASSTMQDIRRLRVAIAVDHREITTATRAFAVELAPALAILALLLIAAVSVQVAVGLAPFDRLKTAVSDIIQGRTRRLPVDVPSEVRPLADEINSLLAAQEQVLAKARARAADLAHGLKTPLQVLAADIRTLRAKGERTIADEINEVAETLRRHVDRELARARTGTAAATTLHEANFVAIAGRVVNVLQRTPRGQELDFAIDAPVTLTVPLDEADLAETIGNLAENASRFAREHVRIAATGTPTGVEIAVADDGPGIPAEQRERALARGASLDTRTGGTGLGLAIVADTAEAYGGALRLEDAAPGLRAVVTIPRRNTG
jgi:signal transduction histidine kinase